MAAVARAAPAPVSPGLGGPTSGAPALGGSGLVDLASVGSASVGSAPAWLGLLASSSAARRRGPAGERLLPVAPGLESLLPGGGLRRGSTVTVTGSTSLLLALLAGPSRSGAWCAVVGFTSFGVLAAAEAGVALERLALVGTPGRVWPAVTAALLDAFDVVVVRPPVPVRIADAHRLAARARERAALLVPVGPWAGADLRLSVSDERWDGLGEGYGYLRTHRALVHAEGRGSFARPRQTAMWLAGDGPAGDRPAAADSPRERARVIA